MQNKKEMDFQKLLLQVSQALNGDEVTALAFLCTDLGRRNSVDSAGDLFSLLMDQDLLSPEKPELLTELLLIIQRPRLLRDVGLSDQECTSTSLISSYRKLLYCLSEEITAKDLKSIKFMLAKKLPRRKLEENVPTLAVFLEMERADLICETNLDMLENILMSVCPVLKEKIHQFRTLPVQESSRQRSLSFPLERNQASPSFPTTGSSGLQTISSNSSNTSIDVSVNFEDRHEGLSNAFTRELSNLDIKSETYTVVDRRLSQENTAMSESQSKAEDVGEYPMTRGGICVVMNNFNFAKYKTGLQNREGTMIDENSLRKVFEWLGFQVQVHNDCDRKKMMSVIWELSRQDHSQIDCLVCCVLSHGQEGGVYGVDGQIVSLAELTAPFEGQRCPSLVKKPKLFFIQACQGNQKQEPVETDGHESDEVSCDARKVKDSISNGADFLLGMATLPSFVSYRERKNGTWYIQSLCQNLAHMVPRGHDLMSILTKVNADVSKKTDPDGKKKQMPQPAFSLTKKVVFPIPQMPPPNLYQ